jgi:hypothetical protein
MSTFKFADYMVEPDRWGESNHVWLICPHCPETRQYFAFAIDTRSTIGDLHTLAWDHHTQYHREPHLEGNGQ